MRDVVEIDQRRDVRDARRRAEPAQDPAPALPHGWLRSIAQAACHHVTTVSLLRVVAIIVTYRPDLDELSRLVDEVHRQVAETVIVDNDPSQRVAEWFATRRDDRVHYLRLGTNQGIATAQNAGIEWARDRGAEFVVLFDQDSLPAFDMIERLLEAERQLTAAGHPVAAVGPWPHALRPDEPAAFVRLLWLDDRPAPTDETIEVDFLISSGCLIPMATLAVVGDMRDELFIDYVDAEWGVRAATHGFRSFGVRDAIMHHQLGDSHIEFLGRKLPMHSPLRHYYHFRNAVWTYQQRAPLRWKALDGYRLLLRFAFYSVFARPQTEHIAMMARGIRDALRGRLGPVDAPISVRKR